VTPRPTVKATVAVNVTLPWMQWVVVKVGRTLVAFSQESGVLSQPSHLTGKVGWGSLPPKIQWWGCVLEVTVWTEAGAIRPLLARCQPRK